MTDFTDALSLSSGGLKAQSQRLRHISENIANVDTPGYRRKTVSFENVLDPSTGKASVQTGPMRLSQAALEQVFDPTHPLANATGYYDGSNVNLVMEIADAREAQRSYEANLKLFEQSRKMSSGLMDLLRK
ncbi:flagellar basal body rod protein FlgC [Nereida sp. MMG025]|uniref:flagellar basal body rod protein FlgC n=1 Tax=Nereida sp. MMG025 TaxID=2909981 RepID=UPI001F482DCC|nr:flagellar basal body rod protein FlgC [Nereida sp. MMG025]MCF6444684.1 flagellar basal body rod protein FlgC [Nereida sp. MMG025]